MYLKKKTIVYFAQSRHIYYRNNVLAYLYQSIKQTYLHFGFNIPQVLGNHEFDNGIEGVVPYMEHLDSKVVTANIIDDEEPTMHGLYEKSIIVERNGRRIGIIGVIIATTDVSTKLLMNLLI